MCAAKAAGYEARELRDIGQLFHEARGGGLVRRDRGGDVVKQRVARRRRGGGRRRAVCAGARPRGRSRAARKRAVRFVDALAERVIDMKSRLAEGDEAGA